MRLTRVVNRLEETILTDARVKMLEERLAKLTARQVSNEACIVDARRYRWLRREGSFNLAPEWHHGTPAELDNYIDAALQRETGKKR